jgi:hypothetical protein
VGWLFDRCPGDLREHDLLHRQPLLLAYVAAGQVQASLEGIRATRSTARADLAGALPPETVSEAVDLLHREEARLAATLREVRLVVDALRGARHRARL